MRRWLTGRCGDMVEGALTFPLMALVTLALAAAPIGFLVAAVAAKGREICGPEATAYRPRHAAYDLKKLRAKNWVRIIPKSRSYEVVPEGLQAMTAILVLRDKIIKPLLAAMTRPLQIDPPQRTSPLDVICRTLHGDMCKLFHLLGMLVPLLKQHDRQFSVDVGSVRA